jgi:hypothetical protein
VWGFITPQNRAALLPAALDKLSRWHNIDKHRVIHAAVLAGALQLINPPAPPEFKFSGGGATYATLEDGACVLQRPATPAGHDKRQPRSRRVAAGSSRSLP